MSSRILIELRSSRLLPNKPRGIPRVDDRRVLNGIFWVLRSGAPWRDLPQAYGPRTTCYNRFVRWRQAGVWDRIIMDALAAGHDAAVQMIDTSVFEARSPSPAAGVTTDGSGCCTRSHFFEASQCARPVKSIRLRSRTESIQPRSRME